MFKYGPTSLARLKQVDINLQRLMHRAIEISPIDFSISQGKRSLKQQQELYAKGRTRTQLDIIGLTHIAPAPGPVVTWSLKSNHLTGRAVDVAVLIGGKVCWDERYYAGVADAVRQASQELNIPIVWGAIWDKPLGQISDDDLNLAVAAYKKRYEKTNIGKKAKLDYPHFELARIA